MKWKIGLVLVLSILLVSFSGCVETPEPTPTPEPTIHTLFTYYDTFTRERAWFTITLYPNGEAIFVSNKDPYKPFIARVVWELCDFYEKDVYRIQSGFGPTGFVHLRLYPDNTCLANWVITVSLDSGGYPGDEWFDRDREQLVYRGIWSYTPIPTPIPVKRPTPSPEPVPDLRFIAVDARNDFGTPAWDAVIMTAVGTAVVHPADLAATVNGRPAVIIGEGTTPPHHLINAGDTIALFVGADTYAHAESVRIVIVHVPTGYLLMDATMIAKG